MAGVGHVTKNGVPTVVVVAVEDLESLEETLAILSEEDTMRQLREAEREVAAGDTLDATELPEANGPKGVVQVTYRLAMARSASRAPARGLPAAVASAVVEFVTGALLENPQRVGKPLQPPLDGKWSARRAGLAVRDSSGSCWAANQTTVRPPGREGSIGPTPWIWAECWNKRAPEPHRRSSGANFLRAGDENRTRTVSLGS